LWFDRLQPVGLCEKKVVRARLEFIQHKPKLGAKGAGVPWDPAAKPYYMARMVA
jgi:hypothetical protein